MQLLLAVRDSSSWLCGIAAFGGLVRIFVSFVLVTLALRGGIFEKIRYAYFIHYAALLSSSGTLHHDDVC